MAKILIMDDEPGLRNVVFGMLKPTGHTLFVTEDGKQAIEVAQKEKPDLALLDMRVPDMDGLEVVSHLKQMDPRVQCIMLSGFGDVESAVAAMKQGAFDYISKPFKIEEVLRVVNKALQAQASTPQTASAPTAVKSAVSGSTITVPQSYTPAKKKRGLWIGAGIAVVALIGFFALKFFSGGGKPDQFMIPYSNPSALAWDGQNLWVADWASQSVYKHNMDSQLGIANTFSLVENHPTGLAWDGDYVWTCSSMEKKITKHNKDATLTPVVSFPNPLQEPSALAWDGVYLWCADGLGGKLYKLKMVGEGLSIAGVFDGVATNPCGMFFYQNHLWVADGESGKIFEQDSGTLSVIGVYTLEPYASKTERLSGMTFDGKSIWTCTQKSSKIFKHSFTSLKKINI